jgi:hypothetical protein
VPRVNIKTDNSRDAKADLERGDHQAGDRHSTTVFPAVFDLVQCDELEGDAQDKPPH